MSVYKRGEKWHYRFMWRSKRYSGPATQCKSERQAQTFESLLLAKLVESGESPQMRKAPVLREVGKLFLKEMEARFEAGNTSANNLRHYRNGWRLLLDTRLIDVRIDQITSGIAAEIRFPGGAWNARAGQQVLSRILNWSAENGYIRTAPRIKRSKATGRSLRIDSKIERQLLAHMERDVADVFLIMLDCGMRPEEVLRMRWENIHWDQGQYWNPFGKTIESRRMVPMADRMRNVLMNRKDNGSQWVFPSRPSDQAKLDAAKAMFDKGASIRAVSLALDISWPAAKLIRDKGCPQKRDSHRVTIAKQWDDARTAAGVDPRYVLYLARHEFATTFLESGGDLGTLMKVMGHTSITTTQKYLHPGIKGAAEVINRRNRAGLAIVRSA